MEDVAVFFKTIMHDNKPVFFLMYARSGFVTVSFPDISDGSDDIAGDIASNLTFNSPIPRHLVLFNTNGIAQEVHCNLDFFGVAPDVVVDYEMPEMELEMTDLAAYLRSRFWGHIRKGEIRNSIHRYNVHGPNPPFLNFYGAHWMGQDANNYWDDVGDQFFHHKFRSIHERVYRQIWMGQSYWPVKSLEPPVTNEEDVDLREAHPDNEDWEVLTLGDIQK